MTDLSDGWSLRAIPDLAGWLFQGLLTYRYGKTFSDRKYALRPIELDEFDYVSLQITRQVRTFDPVSLPALTEANEAAIDMWRPSYGIEPLLDMLGLVQELGGRSLARQIVELTLPATLNHLREVDRERLVSALADAMISHSEFRLEGPLYSRFRKLIAGSVPLPEPVLARALCALIAKSPESWHLITREHTQKFKSVAKPFESPLGSVFFEVERNLTREAFIDLLQVGGQTTLRTEEVWMIPWFFCAHDPAQTGTPLRLKDSQKDAVWISFASRPDDQIEIKRADMSVRVHEALTSHMKDQDPNVVLLHTPRRSSPGAGGVAQQTDADESDSAQVARLEEMVRKALGPP